jgi:hypothetical protein
MPLQDPLGIQGAMQNDPPSLSSHHGRHLNSEDLHQIAGLFH